MCLILTQLKPKIADKDIICYKRVRKTKIKGIYKSSFQGFEYVIRQLYTNNLNIKFAHKIIKHKLVLGYLYNYIEEDMFHSYVGPLYPITSSSLLSWAILKCIIPKGAYYFEGDFSDSPSYTSSQIKILEEI